MITHRPAGTRGTLDWPWIQSRRTFSNNSYWDPRYMHFGDLEVINDDVVEPGHHVPRHKHQGMEIYGYVVQGPCHHTDDLGNDVAVLGSSVQLMNSGSGIWHTEGNNSDQPIRYLQIWIKPRQSSGNPKHSVLYMDPAERDNQFLDVTAHLPIDQDARLLSGIFTQDYTMPMDPMRQYYLYVVLGSLRVNNLDAEEGDGFAFEDEDILEITSARSAEIILLDLRRGAQT